ncbi:hypothetical protein HOO65_020944 [Ceratocystis lukuohia]|uniref:Uncharacterized protein n=1 Tax=Ceratocystis lukuohia TaxID=2019550 RepID=A0ABR4MQ46_9PEZI
MSTTVANNQSRNSAQISVLSSLWDEPMDTEMDVSFCSDSSNSSASFIDSHKTDTLNTTDGTYEEPTLSKAGPTSSIKSTSTLSPANNTSTSVTTTTASTTTTPSSLQVKKRTEDVVSKAASIRVAPSVSLNDQTFNSPTTSIENLRRAAPGVRTRITSLENEVMRSKSPLDKLKDQSRRGQVRKLSQEYEAARSQWVRRAATDVRPKADSKPPGLRPLDTTLNVCSIKDELPKLEPVKAATFPCSFATANEAAQKSNQLSLVTSVPAFSDASRGDAVVSPVASSCYSVTVPETQSTLLEARRQVSLMSNISQYNMGAALYGSSSRPTSRDVYSKASASGHMNAATESIDNSQWTSQPAAKSHREGGRISRSSSHYTDGDDLHNSMTRDSDYHNSGRYSAQWTELTELTMPPTELDKSDDFNRLSLTFPENLDMAHSNTTNQVDFKTYSAADPAEAPPASPKKSIFRAMFNRSKATDLASTTHSHSRQRSSTTTATATAQSDQGGYAPIGDTYGQPRHSTSMATITPGAQNSQNAYAGTVAASGDVSDENAAFSDCEAISNVSNMLGPRRLQVTSLEGQASELAHHNMEPTNASSEQSVYGYMTPSQKAFHLFKKVSQPRKWKESREKKRFNAEKTLAAQMNLASGYTLATTPTASNLMAPSTATSLVPTTVTIIESTNKPIEEEKKSRKTLSKLHSKASKLFGKDLKKRPKKPATESTDTDFSNGLPAIPVSEIDELASC